MAGGRITDQGQAVLEALRTSDAKGLDPDDDEAG